MHGSNGSGGRGAWGVLAVVLLVGIHLVRGGTEEWRAAGPPQPLAAAAPGRSGDAGTPATGTAAAVPAPLTASRPERVRVPALRVDAPVMDVGLDAEGWIDAPPSHEKNLAGWFTGAVTPGEQGTSVVVGHVDTPDGRAVFFGLGALRKGQHVEIARRDGTTAVFAVYGVEVVSKDRFPAERIYKYGALPELRLLTCGGRFTKEKGYDGNVVVSARLVEVRPPATAPALSSLGKKS